MGAGLLVMGQADSVDKPSVFLKAEEDWNLLLHKVLRLNFRKGYRKRP